MTLDEYLITNKEATYILKVHGESMIEAGILDAQTEVDTLEAEMADDENGLEA